MSTNTDARLRDAERAVAKSPGDPSTWDRLAQDYLRAGRGLDALETTARGARLHPADPNLQHRLADLSGEGPWPEHAGCPANRLRTRWPGPDAGVQRWRVRLPRRPVGRPLIDRAGWITIRAEPSGLMRVSPEGRRAELLTPDWPSDLLPILRDGAPATLDPALGELTTDLAVVGERWTAVVDPTDGRVLGLGPDQLRAISREGEIEWRARMPQTQSPSRPTQLALGPGPLIGVALAQPASRDDTARVWGLERATGQFLFQHGPAPGTGRNAALAVALTDDGALVSQLGRELRCDEPNGRPRWSVAVDAATAPAIGEAVVVSVDPFRGARAIDLARGAERWRAPLLKTTLPPLLDGRGFSYLLHTHPDWFACVDERGRLRWRLDLRGLGPPGPPAIGFERTAFFCAGNELVAVR